MNNAHVAIAGQFRLLHEAGCFVLPNPWDAGSACYLHRLGFKALATTSAGYAFSQAKPDGAVPRDQMLDHIREIVTATPLPVNADFLGGFADQPEEVAKNVTRCISTGAAGLSIEDSTGKEANPLYEEALAIERIRAARRAIDDSGIPIVLTARCEAFLVEYPDALQVALRRLSAFAEAGADCLYAPGLTEPDEIAAVVQAVAPKPVNVLVSGFNAHLTVTELAGLGVRRISVGSGLALVAWGAFMRVARELATHGICNGLKDAAAFAELNNLFADRTSGR